jgi:hypothetical protein
MKKNDPAVFYITLFVLSVIVLIIIYYNNKQLNSKENFTPCDVTVENLLDPTGGISLDIGKMPNLNVSCVIQ